MIAVLLAFVAVFVVSGGQEPARTPESRAEIRGRVVDKETGRPLAGAIVSLSRQGGPQKTSVTDDAGRFRFAALEPGLYSGYVTPGRFRATHVPQPLAAESGDSIELAKDEIRQVDVRLLRAYALPVRVLDAAGAPLSDIRLKAFSADSRRLASMSLQQMTDDQGRIRLFGLEAGRYLVCAESWLTGGATKDKLLRTCYPSAEDESAARPVTVDRHDLSEIEIRMRAGRTYSVSALVLDSTGAVARTARVSLNEYDGTSSSGIGMLRQDDGRFRSTKVAPGTYAIEASLGGEDQPEERRPVERAFAPIVVDADTDLTVMLRRTIDVPGRVVLEDPAVTLPPSEALLGVWARLADNPLPQLGPTRSGYVTPDRSFVIEDVFGRRALSVENLPRGWYTKSIRYNGADVTGETIDFDRVRDPGNVEVVLSNRGAVLMGRVIDDSGHPVPKANVMIVPVRQRVTISMPNTTTSVDGSFRFGPTRAGEYVLLALPSNGRPAAFEDRERLARLIALGERITVGEIDERTLDLHVIKER